MTREPDFNKNFIKQNLGVIIQKNIKYLEYQLVMEKQQKVQFHPAAPVIEYHQKSSSSCCLSILASSFHFIGDYRSVTALLNCIEE